jgi:DNA invertase Pin-like site-specific DNA recombinase
MRPCNGALCRHDFKRPVDQRPAFADMLRRLATDGAKTIIVESPDRFARDLAVQLAGHSFSPRTR